MRSPTTATSPSRIGLVVLAALAAVVLSCGAPRLDPSTPSLQHGIRARTDVDHPRPCDGVDIERVLLPGRHDRDLIGEGSTVTDTERARETAYPVPRERLDENPNRYGIDLFVVREARRSRCVNSFDPVPFYLGDAVGFADLHTHQFAELGYGRRVVLAGTPAGGGGYHGLREGLSNLIRRLAPDMLEDDLVSAMLWHTHEDAGPSFRNWTHDQYTHDQTEQAWRRGLRLTVEYAVNQQVACGISEAHGGGNSWTCSDRDNIARQLRAAWTKHNTHSGMIVDAHQRASENFPAAGSGHYRVVTTPREANHAMALGYLAVILGVEASDYYDERIRGGVMPRRSEPDLFDPLCELVAMPRGPGLDPAQTTALSGGDAERAHGMACAFRAQGLSAFIPMHHWNNHLGGPSFQSSSFLQAAFDLAATYGRLHNVSLLKLWRLLEFDSARLDIERWPMVAELARDPVEGVEYVRNGLGLTDLGKDLMRSIALTGALVDVGHMSERAIVDTLTAIDRIAPPATTTPPSPLRPWPVFHSHYTPRATSLRTRDDWEYMASDALLLEVRRRGGVVGIRPPHEPTRSWPGLVPNTCHGSVTSFAQMYQHALSLGLVTGIGTDMNGGTTVAGPRVGQDACQGRNTAEMARLQSTAQMRIGSRFPQEQPDGLASTPTALGLEYARSGLNHVGLLPDFLYDLVNVGQSRFGIDLAGSDLVRTWAAAETFARSVSLSGRTQLPRKAAPQLVPGHPIGWPEDVLSSRPSAVGDHTIDSDGDGLPDRYERLAGTRHDSARSDQDDANDFDEVTRGSNPNDHESCCPIDAPVEIPYPQCLRDQVQQTVTPPDDGRGRRRDH